jgi:hypothetical protein
MQVSRQTGVAVVGRESIADRDCQRCVRCRIVNKLCECVRKRPVPELVIGVLISIGASANMASRGPRPPNVTSASGLSTSP